MKENSSEKYILALDQGTSSSRAIVFDRSGRIISVSQKEFTQYFPKPGWVEHNPSEIWSSQASVIAEAITSVGINGKNIAGIGITNQRETTIVWDAETGQPVYNAIVWQDRRTSGYCDSLKNDGLTGYIRQRTGLIIDAYFSATKIRWILENVEGARAKAEAGKLRFGTVDSWLVWMLTRGEKHVTDVSNASRTMLFNIHTLQWDSDLLKLFGILAVVCLSISLFGVYAVATATAQRRRKEIAIRKIVGANADDIIRMFLREYTLLVLIAGAVAMPLAYTLMQHWLQGYAYRTDIPWWLWGIVLGGIIAVVLLTVWVQVLRAANSNPSEVVKSGG